MHNLESQIFKGKQIPQIYWLIFLAISSVILSLTPLQNWALTIFAILVLGALLMLFGIGSIFSGALLACTFQWLQSATDLFRANIAGVSINSFTQLPYSDQACALSLLGVLIFAFGIRVACGYRPLANYSAITEPVLNFSPGKLAIASILALILSYFVQPVLIQIIPSLSQFFLVIGLFKDALIFLLILNVFSKGKGFYWLFLVIIIATLGSIVSYFSTFKFIFYWLILALITAKKITESKRIIWLSLIIFLTLIFGLYWTAVKGQYRIFLNQGTLQQSVKVSWFEGFNKLTNLVNQTNSQDLLESSGHLAKRIGYTRYFAIVIDRKQKHLIPNDKLLWWQSIKYVLMPRFFNPNKAVLDDSAQTRYYTGLRIAGRKQGTSISMGYMSESYIDFGYFGMFCPIFGLGWLYGKCFSSLTNSKFPQPLGLASAIVIMVLAGGAIETNAVKHLGGLLAKYLSTVAVLHFSGRKIIYFLNSQDKALTN